MITATMTSRSQTQKRIDLNDWGLLSIVMILLGMGMIMVFSATFAKGGLELNRPFYYVSRQILWCGLGLVSMVIVSRIPYRTWERWSVVLMALALFALMAVVIFGSEQFNATRTFFGGSVQPSEPAKIIIVMYVSAWLSSKGERIRDVRVGLLPFSVLMGAIAVLIVAQPNISTAILIVATASIMFFIAGAEMRQLGLVGLGAGATFWLVIKYSSYASGRVQKFMDSIWDPLQSAEYQVQQQISALYRSDTWGQGLGNGYAQLPNFLPVAWSDNIFAVIGEEWGILGTLFVIFLFAMLAYFGLRTALRAPDNFGMLLATGITVSLTLQALLNMAVIVAAAPPTGVTLPFISYGGSSLVTALTAIGILLNISRHAGAGKSSAILGSKAYARFDLGWRNRGARLSGAGSSKTAGTAKRSVRAKASTRRTSRTSSSTGNSKSGRGTGGKPRTGQRTNRRSR